MSQIGNKIKSLRTLKGYSQEELAEAAQVNLRTIQRIENNSNNPRGKTLQLICEALETNTEEIMSFGKEKDLSYLSLVHLSVLSFFVVPLGNIILPLILWVSKKDKIEGLDNLGKNILNFQIVWTTLCVLCMILIIFYPTYFDYAFAFLSIITILNFILPLIFAIKTNKEKNKNRYPNLLRILR